MFTFALRPLRPLRCVRCVRYVALDGNRLLVGAQSRGCTGRMYPAFTSSIDLIALLIDCHQLPVQYLRVCNGSNATEWNGDYSSTAATEAGFPSNATHAAHATQ